MATRMEAFLFLSNLVVFVLVPIDIAFLAGFFELPGDYLNPRQPDWGSYNPHCLQD